MKAQRKYENWQVPEIARDAGFKHAAGGPVGDLYRHIEDRMAVEVQADRLEDVIQSVSRWAGPVTFFAALGGLAYFTGISQLFG